MQQGTGFGVAVRLTMLDVVTQSEATVIEALSKEHNIGQSVVDGQNYHGWQDALENGTKNVKHIAGQPNDDEDD
jgi:hypothetical protein